MEAFRIHAHGRSRRAAWFAFEMPLRDSGCKDNRATRAPDADSPLARRRVRVIVRVVGEGALHVPFARKALMLGQSTCVSRDNSVFILALFLLNLLCGVLASTISAADTDPPEVVWLRRAAKRHGSCVSSEAHGAGFGGMAGGIRVDP